MSCNRADTVLHGYFDNELDALGAAEFERHLKRCFECIDALESLESLCSSMNIAFSRRKCLPCFARKSSLTSALRTLSGSSRRGRHGAGSPSPLSFFCLPTQAGKSSPFTVVTTMKQCSSHAPGAPVHPGLHR